MRIGLIADTHDRVPAIAEFARRFSEAGIAMVLHAGDYCSPFALAPISAAQLALAGVFGHNDGDPKGLMAEAARGVGAELFQSPHSVELDGRRILLVHDLAEAGERSLESHAIVVHGCSHVASTETRGDTLLVNPGEACGWLHGVPTASVLDLRTRQVETLTLDGPEWRT
ncbi:MAG TPA: YfcE family phosphodiesterase [Gemmatimonadaceae bacterium]|nr:YfcE family phosphodiesterase [Gemmatimonadaceae bacterium]